MTRELRTCSVVIDDACQAPANGSRSTRATCYACGEPVCTSPWCSRIRPWPRRRCRVCRNCDETGMYADPEGRERFDRTLMRREGSTASWLAAGLIFLLAGCGSSESLNERQVETRDGPVTCIVLDLDYGGGISCDWSDR